VSRGSANEAASMAWLVGPNAFRYPPKTRPGAAGSTFQMGPEIPIRSLPQGVH